MISRNEQIIIVIFNQNKFSHTQPLAVQKTNSLSLSLSLCVCVCVYVCVFVGNTESGLGFDTKIFYKKEKACLRSHKRAQLVSSLEYDFSEYVDGRTNDTSETM